MTVALTGATGFLGWHVRCALHAYGLTTRPISVGDRFDGRAAGEAIDGSTKLIHCAGVNRGTDDEVREGNLRFAEQIATVIRSADNPPQSVVFANSVQASGNSVYGNAKARAAHVLRDAADSVGAEFSDVMLPNLFGEHGLPFYNSVVATFCHLLSSGGSPTIEVDRELELLHAQDAADLLVCGENTPIETTKATVSQVLKKLTHISTLYRSGEIPDIAQSFDRNLFNTYRSFSFASQPAFDLSPRADARGSFFEVIRSRGGESQASFSTTVPGVSRGDHFHRRKVERFTVIQGKGCISMRRLFSSEVLRFAVTGSKPVAIDMPTLWSHKIENDGEETLLTSFWANELFRPEQPDTVPEAV